eukprot:1156389-Pelagomonas_calceolata.AAC.3
MWAARPLPASSKEDRVPRAEAPCILPKKRREEKKSSMKIRRVASIAPVPDVGDDGWKKPLQECVCCQQVYKHTGKNEHAA